MSTSGKTPATRQRVRAVRAWARDRTVWVELEDGRQVGFPAGKYRRLRDGSDELLAKVRIEARGKALRWEELDEDLTVAGILAGHWLS
jgi:hypothetical protein